MQHDLPSGFVIELAKNKQAMQSFSALSESERDRVVARARLARTAADMRLIVSSLCHTVSAQEFF